MDLIITLWNRWVSGSLTQKPNGPSLFSGQRNLVKVDKNKITINSKFLSLFYTNSFINSIYRWYFKKV